MKKLVRESITSDAPAKPTIKPGTKPTPQKPPSPIRRDRPSVTPKPKAKRRMATAEDVAKRFLSLIKK